MFGLPHVGSYLYNFLQCADHNCDKTYPQYEFTELVKTKCHILDAIKYNMELQSVEKNLFVFPWRQVEIPVAMLNLNFDDFKEHVFHSTVHKKIIEMNDNKRSANTFERLRDLPFIMFRI